MPARSCVKISPRPASTSSRYRASAESTTRVTVDTSGGREGPPHRAEPGGPHERLREHRHPAVAEELVVLLGFRVAGDEDETAVHRRPAPPDPPPPAAPRPPRHRRARHPPR